MSYGLALVFFFGLNLQLDCTRVDGSQVDCRLQKKWFRFLPVGAPRIISRLQTATSRTEHDYDDWQTTLELVGQETTITVPPGYLTQSMGQEAQTRIRNFLVSQESELRMLLGGWLGQTLMTAAALGCFILPGGCALYVKARRIRRRKKLRELRKV
jgi:hypothetical protein